MKKSIISMRMFRIMKQFSEFRALFSIVAVAMILTIVSINPAYGQDTPNEARAEKQQAQYSTEELELLRSKMLELLDTVQDFSGTITPNDTGTAERLQTARKQLEQFTLKDLTALRASIDPSKLKDLTQERATLNEYKPAFEDYNNNYSKNPEKFRSKKSDNLTINPPLSSIADFDPACELLVLGPGGSLSKVVTAANAVYFAAKIFDIALNRGCNQVNVGGTIFAGFGSIGGGNNSNNCIASDEILFAAEKVRDNLRDTITACNLDNTGVDLATIKSNLVSTMTGLTTVNSNVDVSEQALRDAILAAKAAITTDVTQTTSAIRTDVSTFRTQISESLIAESLNVKAAVSSSTATVSTAVGDGTSTLVNIANANKEAILANDNSNRVLLLADAKTNRDFLQADAKTNRDFLQANAKANRDFLEADAKTNREFLLRTQIEADLSSTDGATFVALFLTPSTTCSQPVLNDKGIAVTGSTQCGYLDFARAVVVQTIANLAGTNTAQANSFLAKGDTYKNSGDYKQAYLNYRLAYKTAIK